MRKRINKNAVCSSENYSASRRVHQEYLKELHNSFCTLGVSDSEPLSQNRLLFRQYRMVTIRVFGKPLQITEKEYSTYCMGFRKY